MSYKIRKSLADKIEIALAAAKGKEGKEVTVTPLGLWSPPKMDIVYEGNGNKLLKDGRYITEFWNAESKEPQFMVIDNMPVDVLRFSVENDHDVERQKRHQKKHEDYKYQKCLETENKGETGLENPIDYCLWSGKYVSSESRTVNEEKSCISIENLTEDENSLTDNSNITPEIRLIAESVINGRCKLNPAIMANSVSFNVGYTRFGYFNQSTRKDIYALLNCFLAVLTSEKQQWYELLFSDEFSQKQIAEMKGISEAAVSKRKKWFIDKFAECYRLCGFPVPTEAELKAEKKAYVEKRRSIAEKYS